MVVVYLCQASGFWQEDFRVFVRRSERYRYATLLKGITLK